MVKKTRLFHLAAALLLAQSVAQAQIWEPSAGHVQLPIWPGKVPDALPDAKPESVGPPKGRDWWPRANDVSRPTMTMYAPKGRNTGVAVVVFPGGGYRMLAMDLEGTEVCDWLTSRGITCVLLKYRVPGSGPWWDSEHHRRVYPKVPTALQDAQRTIGLVRQHAREWHVDPRKVGVIGFSAGGHLAASVSTNFAKRIYPAVDRADSLSCRPDFAIVVYPGHLWIHEDEDKATRNQQDLGIRPDIRVRADTPPTFLLQAQDDFVDGVSQSLAYYVALKKAGVPTEMHLYANGGHAFGLRPSKFPISKWPRLVDTWLETIGMTAAPEMTIVITAFEKSPDGGQGLARDTRVRWALEEAGQPYEVRLVSFKAMKERAHLRLNPFGQIPTYEDGSLALFETGAIVFHVADRYPGLFPDDADARARAITWMFAALNSVEPVILEIFTARILERDQAWGKERWPLVQQRVRARLTQLSDRLGDAEWLDGAFSAGDLLMVSVLLRARPSGMLEEFPTLAAYVARGEARPAYQRAFAAQLAVNRPDAR